MIEDLISSFELNISTIEKISHEDSLSSDVYKVILSDGSFRILKIPFDDKRYKRELYFLNYLRNILPVPKVFDQIAPLPDKRGAILMEFLSGDILSLNSLNSDILYEMGKLLASLHIIYCPKYGDIVEKKKLLIPFLNNFYESYEECAKILSKAFLEKIRLFVEKKISNIEKVDGPHIIHRDFRPGNILWSEGKISGLIDFENTKCSFAEEDFIQMHHLVWSTYPQMKKPFLEGYKAIRPLPDYEKILPVLRVCKALGAVGFTIVRNTYLSLHKHVFDQNMTFLNDFFK